jgi:hypothetical protein
VEAYSVAIIGPANYKLKMAEVSLIEGIEATCTRGDEDA